MGQNYGGYLPHMNALDEALGVEVGLLDLGGNHLCILAEELPGELSLMITDAEGFLSVTDDRLERLAHGERVGFAVVVCVSGDHRKIPLVHLTDYTAEDPEQVVSLAREALRMARGKW